MKSYHINKGAGLSGLTIREHDVPVPGPREVLVRVRASSLNFRELMILILGYYPLPVRPDVVPVSDGAGEVIAVGSGVTRAMRSSAQNRLTAVGRVARSTAITGRNI